jgi:peptide/histidine transporter 3/4
VVTAAAMAVAAAVEARRLGEAREGRRMSILWLAPQEAALGAGQVLATVGAMDFFYSEAPHAMRGLVSALCLANLALGSYASSLLVSAVGAATGSPSGGWIPRADLDAGHVDYFYWLLCAITLANAAVFALAARWFSASPPSPRPNAVAALQLHTDTDLAFKPVDLAKRDRLP